MQPEKRYIQTTLPFARIPRVSPQGTPRSASPTKLTFRPFSESRTPLHPSAVLASVPCEKASNILFVDEDVESDDELKRRRQEEDDTDVDEELDLDRVEQEKPRKPRTLTIARMFAKRQKSDGAGGNTDNQLGPPVFKHWVLCNFNDSTPIDSPQDEWNPSYVKLPCSPRNTMQWNSDQRAPSQNQPLFAKWDVIRTHLQGPIEDANDLTQVLYAYNPSFRRRWDLSGLEYYLNVVVGDVPVLFEKIIPGMADLALRLPQLFPEPIPFLRKGYNSAITLSQIQVMCLLANAFFCTFPRRNDTRRGAEHATFPSINFNSLFTGSKSKGLDMRRVGKLHALFHYFRRVLSQHPTGSVTFHRRVLSPSEFPHWSTITEPLGPLEVRSQGTIEDDGEGMLQVDFANKFIGGGVLGHGCVQEEIRFIINPELLVSRLFTEELLPHEAVFMIGAERFSNYTGYGDTFEWAGNYVDKTERDGLERRKTEIVAIDATYFPPGRAENQYRAEMILREVNKAFVGFGHPETSCLEGVGVATGNWGCGAFNGDPELKSLVQLIAASVAKRPILYFTFGDEDLAGRLRDIYEGMTGRGVSVGQLFRALTEYWAYRGQMGLFEFLRRRFCSDGTT
ncbi:hypothetical protein SpCBS45565_g03241 [Spizellomyces sp. 'palustris']|nr:hypothetical protein SpCBS45565_g03241 [Spizellomyces sp. 'palustris']